MTLLVSRPFREWTLGTKLAGTFFIVVVSVAALVSVSVLSHARRALDDELKKRGASLVEHLARLSVDLVLQDDLWAHKVVRDTASGSGDSENVVAYAMVLDGEGRVLAHSDPANFPMGEPIGRDAVGRPAGSVAELNVYSAQVNGQGTIHDLTAPIILDKQRIGVARIGITTRHLDAAVRRTTWDVVIVSVMLAGCGVALGFWISRRMTRPLRPAMSGNWRKS